MSGVQLYNHQVDALAKMKNGCILNGTVGSGKSRTALAYYYCLYGGKINTTEYVMMKNPCDLYIITTAKKRDKLEWEEELLPFKMTPNPETNAYRNKIVIDSWNNISKYLTVRNAFFILDEQRVIGSGAWAKTFLKLAQSNQWVLLTATPGDTWSDYSAVFIANGFFKNKTDFCRQHVVYSPFTNFPKIDRYVNEGVLIKMRNSILVNMSFKRLTIPLHENILCDYDKYNYDYITKNRWNIYTSTPIKNANEYCLCLRRLVNSDASRKHAVLDIVKTHKKVIVFYSYNYELDILRDLFHNYPMSEWNGHNHEEILKSDRWVYLVQYTAGNEGWNCIECDTMIFYSQNYSYKVMIQAAGRIDRINTPFVYLYYFHLKSDAKIDKAINNALNRKKKFNERSFAPEFPKQDAKTDPEEENKNELP